VGYDYSANQAIDQKHTIGGLWYNGSCNMMDVYGQSGIDMFLTWIIFGDASLVVRTNIPEPINVSHTGTFLIGTNTYSVSTGFSDALVALSNEGELLASGYTDASGSVILELLNPPTDPGEMTLTVTAYDRITNIQPITVISPEGPYLIVNDVTTTTNDDSIVEYGENVSITISVENMGNDPAMDIMINLESDDPFIEITNGNIFIYAIDENETLVIDDAFSAQISENVPNEQSIEIQISMMTDNNNWTSDFTITAFAPDLSVNSVSIENDDNSNGILDAGESADLQVVLENSGGSDLDPFTLNIESETPFVTIVSGTGVTEGIEEGSQSSFNFSILVDVDTPLGYNAEFLLTGTSEIGYEYSESFVLSVGLVLEDFETGNFYLYPWEFSGDSPWIITEESFAGTFSAKSGEIFDNQSSVLSVTLDVLENGEITFYRKVSSSPNNDYLKFDIDDSVFGQWSGNMDWSSVAYPVSEGQHTFTWTYIKDGWDSQGEDSGWIDYIIFPTVVPPQLPELYISTQSLNTSALPGESDTDSFIIENTGSEELNYTITHSASGTRDEFDIPDSPDQYNWSYNTLTDMGWIEYEITEPNITMNNWTLSFNWQTDWWPAEGSFWVTSPNGTTAEIASALESGTYSITLDSFAGESLPGTWTLWIEDTYGDGGHQASNITLSVESAEPENNWLTVDTYFGMIPPTESQHINVMCDAADLIEGDYYGTINIYSNDPYNSETAVEVFFTVGEIVNEVTIHIINDWNMIGIPFDYENTEVQNIFPNSVENTLFSFSETGYSSESELQLGTGYWLRFDVTESIAMTGTPVENLSISLMEGWNLISGYSFPIPVENIIDAENILVPNTLYGYSENGYSPSSVVNPGYGYWIRTSGSGEIQLSTSNRVNKTVPFDNKLKNANRIVLNGIPLFFGIPVNEEEIVYYSLPPKPPSGATDIRFSGDTKLCQSNECMIDVINNGQPLEIECELKDGKSWEILDESENVFECEGIQVLKVDSESETFVLRKSTSSHTPTEFALFPAHPNPFNPVTTIRFSVGVGTFGSNISTHTTSTSLQVYDITGKLVEILVDKQLSPGIHSVKWNATGFPSGMYFILFEGSGKRIIQKVVLMK
ncbi:MAG: C25 family peptidase C-terminal domain-containing protein, partial [Candidatus Marinimicrobia bacterium]|nr:C25 family peptidase C-terminal domain-containing protein [Candidatus Neomarinimicrobiota bacterium]